jgi:anti-sigma B factor antagonist
MDDRTHSDSVRLVPDDPAGVVVCVVRGEIDVSNVGELEAGLAATIDRGPAVVVDLSEVTFFASAGIRALFDACGDRRGRPIAVVTGPGVRTVFRICGIAAVVPCHAERDAAVASCRTRPAAPG